MGLEFEILNFIPAASGLEMKQLSVCLSSSTHGTKRISSANKRDVTAAILEASPTLAVKVIWNTFIFFNYISHLGQVAGCCFLF